MRVFLLHGMARTAASMLVLSHRLKSAGHRISLFGYHVIRESLEEIAERLEAKVRETLSKDAGDADSKGAPDSEVPDAVPYAIVGHSLGAVVTRLASPRLPAGFCRFVMLGPPNRPPVTARALEDNPIFRLLTRDAGQQLADPAFFEGLPLPSVPTLVVAGTGGPSAGWLPFEGRPNDGVVAVEEARLEGVPCLEVPGVHTFLMNRRDVFEAVRSFLEDPASAAGLEPPGSRAASA